MVTHRSDSRLEVRQRAVAAVHRGLSNSQVADTFGVDRKTLYRWLVRHNTDGIQGLHRRPGSRRPTLLKTLDEQKLRRIVLRPATQWGFETDLWTVARVRLVILSKFGVSLSNDTVWRRLRRAGLSYQKPQRQYFEIDPVARDRWLREEAPRIRECVQKHRGILYFEDEANVSLTAFLGKTWAPRGKTPTVAVTGKRAGVAAMSAISGSGRLVFRLYDKRIASTEVITFLQQMLDHHRTRHLVVVMDQAPPHTSKMTHAYIDSQPRLHVFHLPKYSPDWNPDEKVWNHLKHHELSAHRAKTKAELKTLTRKKLTKMAKDPDLLCGLFFRCCVADFFG